MKSRVATYVLIMAAMSLLLLVAFGCTSTGKKDGTEKKPTDEGRIIVPDSKPSTENPDTGTDSEKSTGGTEVSTSAGAGEPGVETHDIKVALFIDGKEHPMEQPIMVHEGEQVKCEFRVTSVDSDLTEYTIENPNRVGLKQQAKLKGREASIPYVFTFIAKSWGPGGIRITVANKAGSAVFKQVMVFPAEPTGPGGTY
jgi:hypothetical protein